MNVSAHKAIQAGTLGKLQLVKMLTLKIFAGVYFQDHCWHTPSVLQACYGEIQKLINTVSSNAEAIVRVAFNLLTQDDAETIAHIENI